MKLDYDLWITNCITNDVEIIHDYSVFAYSGDIYCMSSVFFAYIKPYLDKQIPVKLEFIYKKN